MLTPDPHLNCLLHVLVSKLEADQLTSGSRGNQVAALGAQDHLLDAQSGVVAERVKTAHLDMGEDSSKIRLPGVFNFFTSFYCK